MPYIALFLKKNCKNIGALEVSPTDILVITYTYC